MTHTTNYNLNKFEATDRVTRDGFNDNADAIDAALKSVSNAAGAAQSTANSASIAAAAAQSAANAAAAAAAAGCRVVIGSYTGTGTKGASNPNSLTFGFQPKLVIITAPPINEHRSTTSLAIWMHGQGYGNRDFRSDGSNDGSCLSNTLSWSGNTLSWYATGDNGANLQLNTSGTVYYYMAIG